MKKNILKSVIIIAMGIIIGLVLMRACNTKIRDFALQDVKKDEIVVNEDIEKYDLNELIKTYGINSNDDLNEFIRYIANKLTPAKLANVANVDGHNFKSWNWYNITGNDYLLKFKEFCYEDLINKILNNTMDWDKLPLSNNFINKFNADDGCLLNYGIDDKYQCYDFDFNNKSFVIHRTNDDKSIDYDYYKFTLDSDGNLDDIVLETTDHYFDENGEYIIHPNKYFMDSESSAETVLYHILPNKSYFFFDGDEGYNWKTDDNSHWNIIKELGVTDSLMKQHDENDGLLSIKSIEDITIYDIDMNNKKAKVKVVANGEIKECSIEWNIEEDFKLSSISINEI